MHDVKNYQHLIGSLPGFNADLIEEHLKLYEGYVKKYNEICATLPNVEKKGNYSYAPHSELVRRKSVAWNGAKLHELYFDALTPSGSVIPSVLEVALVKSFGSMDAWKQDLLACASATPGWVLLVNNRGEETLEHYVVFEHANNVPAGVEILLALDCWEHAFAKQYGTNKSAYLEAFLNNIHWEGVEKMI
ncbi:superoxide dismutase [Candidatus Uhrbacteria bacterium]|nr:superoxide dismutase [Candidatus Uhrbacteria bacterium]